MPESPSPSPVPPVTSGPRRVEPAARPETGPAGSPPGPWPRIVVVTNLWPGSRRPAWGSFVADRVDALRRHGAQVDVVAVGDHPSGLRRYAGLAASTVRAAASTTRDVPTVVEAHIAYPTGLFASPLAARLAAPLVLFAHGSDVLRLPDRSPTDRALVRRLFATARLVVANSDYLAGEVTTRLGVGGDRLVVVPPGIDHAAFAAAARRRTAGGAPRCGLAFVANLIPRKGLDLLVEALVVLRRRGEAVPPLTVAGDGAQRAALERRCAAEGLPVRFLGAVPHAEVPDLLARAEVVAVPSREEALGLAALESMAAGAVTVVAGVGGLADLTRDGVDGLVVAPDDPEALADGLIAGLRLARDPARRAAVAAAADATARRHAVDAAAATTLGLFADLVRPHVDAR